MNMVPPSKVLSKSHENNNVVGFKRRRCGIEKKILLWRYNKRNGGKKINFMSLPEILLQFCSHFVAATKFCSRYKIL